LLYGDDPAQGFVVGRRFAHPVMRIAFEAPPGFTLTNSPQAILIEGPDGARGEFSGGRLPPAGIEAYAEALLRQMLGDTPAEVASARRAVVHDVPAVVLQAVVSTRSGAVPLSLAAFAGADGSAYHFLLVSHPGTAPSPALATLFGSFRMLTNDEVAALKPRYLRVRRVAPGETPRSLAREMASDQPLERFLMLNDRKAGDPLRPGEAVKLIAWGA
ncbi:MAG: hypothetical protein ABW128_00350, partial [Rhizorhabdus sp.]